MKQFFTILYGGLVVMIGSVLLYRGGIWFVNDIAPELSHVQVPSLATVVDAFVGQPTDGTNISGLSRIIRYTAHEEEDLIDNASGNQGMTRDGSITATSYIVKDLNTGQTIISSKPETLLPIASLTKLVTAVVARKVISPNEHITISKEIINTYGNTASFRAGETFLASDLMYPLLMVSSNDAAEAFAYDYGRKQFLEAMNNFVQSIGAYRTYFRDPSGLSPDNESTATDIAIILDWIRENDPEILEITREKSIALRNHNWVNPTHFLNWSNYRGGKNGYIPESDRTSAMLFAVGEKEDMYAVVLLGSRSRDSDIVNLLTKIDK